MADSTLVYTPTRAPDEALPTWRAAFLGTLALHGNVSEAARAAGVARDTVYKAKVRHPDFAADWLTAERIASDVLLREAWRRAVEGSRQYKFHPKSGKPLLFPKGHELAGQPYYEMAYSDGLLTLLLKARLPEQFGDRLQVDSTVRQAPPYDLSKLSTADLLALREMKRKLQTEEGDEDGN